MSLIVNHEEAAEYAALHPESNVCRAYLELCEKANRADEAKAGTSVSDYSRGKAQVIARRCFDDHNAYLRKSGAPEVEFDQGIVEVFARALSVWIESSTDMADRLNFLKTKGLAVGMMKEAGKEPYLAYVIEPGSELCDLETINRLTAAEIAAKSWEETASKYAKGSELYRGILQACYEELPDEMKRRARLDADGNVAAEPYLSNMPDVVKSLAGLVELRSDASRAELERGTAALSIPSQQENPDGLHRRYVIAKADGTCVDPNAIYFVLRLDNDGSDPAHIKAGRFAARMYALHLKTAGASHLAQLANELPKLCDGIDHDEQVDFPGFNVAELCDMFVNPVAFDLAHDYNAGQEVQADAFGAKDSADWHKRRGEFLKSRAEELEAKI